MPPPPTHVDLDVLVGRAGWAVARTALAMLGGAYGRRVVVIAGRGNNGADGRVAAGLLGRRGARVRMVDAGATDAVGPCDLVIDAAYGTGFHGQYTAPDVPAGVPVLAVDIPSGIEGDTGAAAGHPGHRRPYGHLRGPQARAPPGRRGRTGRPGGGGRHRARPRPSGHLGHGGRRCGRPVSAAPPRWQQVVGGRSGGGRVAGHERRRRPRVPGPPTVRGRAWSAWAYPAGRWPRPRPARR